MKIGLYFDYKESWMMVLCEIKEGECKTTDYYNEYEDDFDKSYELMELKTDKIFTVKFNTYDDIMNFELENEVEIINPSLKVVEKLTNEKF